MTARRSRPGGGYQLTTHVAVILLLLVTFISAGYYLLVVRPEPPGIDATVLAELQSALATWEARRPAKFRYVVERQCACPAIDRQPFIVTETGDEVTARFPIPIEADNGEMLAGPPRSLSIAQLFYLTELAHRQGRVVQAIFDENYGFPSRLSLDPPDSEIIEIRDFEIMQYR